MICLDTLRYTFTYGHLHKSCFEALLKPSPPAKSSMKRLRLMYRCQSPQIPRLVFGSQASARCWNHHSMLLREQFCFSELFCISLGFIGLLKDAHLASALPPAWGFILTSPFLLPPASSWGWLELSTIIILLTLYVLGLDYRCFVGSVTSPLTRVSHGGFILNSIFHGHFVLHNCSSQETLYFWTYRHPFYLESFHLCHAEEPREGKTATVSCLVLAGQT